MDVAVWVPDASRGGGRKMHRTGRERVESGGGRCAVRTGVAEGEDAAAGDGGGGVLGIRRGCWVRAVEEDAPHCDCRATSLCRQSYRGDGAGMGALRRWGRGCYVGGSGGRGGWTRSVVELRREPGICLVLATPRDPPVSEALHPGTDRAEEEGVEVAPSTGSLSGVGRVDRAFDDEDEVLLSSGPTPAPYTTRSSWRAGGWRGKRDTSGDADEDELGPAMCLWCWWARRLGKWKICTGMIWVEEDAGARGGGDRRGARGGGSRRLACGGGVYCVPRLVASRAHEWQGRRHQRASGRSSSVTGCRYGGGGLRWTRGQALEMRRTEWILVVSRSFLLLSRRSPPRSSWCREPIIPALSGDVVIAGVSYYWGPGISTRGNLYARRTLPASSIRGLGR
ncbi:hypothetical protein C8R44DRAFT_330145 [Mycena epipterygia]|nr:hypothetical protein C8R44DRAFT_330145 [Mycena epipterygia]